jgi:hypothetical protein
MLGGGDRRDRLGGSPKLRKKPRPSLFARVRHVISERQPKDSDRQESHVPA